MSEREFLMTPLEALIILCGFEKMPYKNRAATHVCYEANKVLADEAARLMQELVKPLCTVTDVLNQLRDETLRLAKGSFDNVDCGIAANVADAAIDEIERLRRLEQATKTVLEAFEKDEAQGYRSKDRQYAIAILRNAIQ